MTRTELINRISDGIIHQEGLLLTPVEAAKMNLVWPCIAQIYCNVGNIRDWKDKNNKAYPKSKGYVNFLSWAGGDARVALAESYRVLKVQIGYYIDGKLHGGKSPTLLEMFKVYAPSADNNLPMEYAKNVSNFVGTSVNVRLNSLITA